MTLACALAAVSLAAPGAPPPPPGADTASTRSSLEGMTAVRLVVERIPAGVERQARLRHADVVSDVAAGLARSGLVVSADAPAILYVNVALACDPVTCAYNVAVEVQQPVRLSRRPRGETLVAATWSSGAMGLAGRRTTIVRRSVREQVARFVADWRAANAKR